MFEIATSRREGQLGMDGEKKETNAAWKVADIKGLTIQAEQLKGMLVVWTAAMHLSSRRP